MHTLGIIGYGGFGRFLHEVWSAMDDVRVVAVADADPSRRPEGVAFHGDWRGLVADPAVEIVSIVTPPASHAEIACEAMRAGKHVVVEKPVAVTLEEAERIRAARDRYGRVAAVDYLQRFNPLAELLAEWSRSGVFGALRRVAVENFAQDAALPPEHWFWDERVSGGILVEHAVHFIDLVGAMTPGKRARVSGLSQRRNPGQRDRVLAVIAYEDGPVTTHFHQFSGPEYFERTTLRFVFDLLDLELEGWIPLSGRFRALATEEGEAALGRLPGGVAAEIPSPVDEPVRAGGVEFPVRRHLTGSFALPTTKLETYAACLRALLADVLATVEDPARPLRVPLEDGIASLRLALEAAGRD